MILCRKGKIMEEQILKSVAMPPRLLWAPQVPAILNIVLHFIFILGSVLVFSLNPLYGITSLVLCHIALILAGLREPHLSTMIQSQGKFILYSYNAIYKKPGRKLAP